MNKSAKRLLFTIVLAALFLGIYAKIMYSIGKRHYEDLIVIHNRHQTENALGVLDQCQKTEKEIGEAYCGDLNAEVRLKTIALSGNIADGRYTGAQFFDSAMVVRIVNGAPELPKEAEGMFPGLTKEAIESEYAQTRLVKEKGEGAPQEVLLTSGRIADDWYYVLWTPADEFQSYVTKNIDIAQHLNKMADEYGGEMFIAGTDGTLLYASDGIRDAASILGLGITAEDLEKTHFQLSLKEKEQYICTPAKLRSGQIFVFCYSIMDGKNAFRGSIVTQSLFALALLTGLITWCFSVIWMVGAKELTEEQLKKYSPPAVKKKTARLGALSVILVFLVAFITVSMQYMYEEDKIASAALSLLGRQLEGGSLTASDLKKTDPARYEAFGKEIAEILTEDPKLLNQADLSLMADMISADYLIVFDDHGNEIGCSKDYTGFSLGIGKEEPSTDFRRLLKGIPSIVHETEKDFITGESRRIVGVRYKIPEQAAAENTETGSVGSANRYGVILISLPAGSAESAAELSADRQAIYRMMVSGGEMIIEVDPETMTISSCSREEYTGANAGVIGIKTESLSDGHMDFFRISKKWYFSISRTIGGRIFYYLTDNTEMFLIGTAFALLTTVIFLFGYGLIAWYALRGYNSDKYEALLQLIRKGSQKERERLEQNNQAMGSFIQNLADMLPEQKYKAVMQIEMGLFMTVLLLIAVSDSPMSRYSALNFVIDGNWTKGINIFGIVAAIMVASIEYLLYLILKVFFLAFYGTVSARAETVGRLIRSLLNYILVIGAVCMALNFLGVDTATLLASLGLFSLAVSLGAKDIVADILSGISIVFEETYSVGDIVEIGGFKGKVLEIGVRSTKLLGRNNDVKTINNHDISDVINLSKRPSTCTVSFSVRASDPLGEIEAMLARELPAMRDKIPGVSSGPKYMGVTGFDDGILTLSIGAEGKEENISAIQKGLNKAVQSLYERGLLVPVKKDTNIILQHEGEK